MNLVNRRTLMAASSAFALLGRTAAFAQAAGKVPDSEWTHYANDLASTRYVPFDQINASNFNKLEMVWRYSTNSLGPRLDADFQSTPLFVKGRVYCNRRLPPRCGVPGRRHRRADLGSPPR